VEGQDNPQATVNPALDSVTASQRLLRWGLAGLGAGPKSEVQSTPQCELAV